MNELREKRTLNAKHFLRADGSFQMDAHVGHIHYFDKIGGTGMRGIDWTLNFDEVKRGWSFKFHSFRPFIPEFADQWVVFQDLFQDKDQSVKYRAHSSHTKGRLVMPSEIGMERETSQNCVIYDDAFGEGLDYIIYFTRSTMKKVVRIRDGYKASEDMRFTWDVEFPTGKKVFRAEQKEKIGTGEAYELDTKRSKAFDSNKLTLIGDDKNDGKEWYTYLRDFKCWDSGKMGTYHAQSIVVDFDAENMTLTKIIPATFLKESTGDVFSDTTTSYYAGAGDGTTNFERPTTGTWAYIHDTATSAYATNSAATFIGGGSEGCGIGCGKWSELALTRAFLPFNTSSIPDTDTITSASLYMYIVGNYASGGTPAYDYYAVVETNQASTSTIGTGDHDECGKSAANGWSSAMSTDIIKLSDNISASSLTNSTYKEMPLNATGISLVSKTGFTKLGVRNGYDLTNNSSSTSNNTYTFFHSYTSEQTGTGTDPYLSVTYSSATTYNQALTATPSMSALFVRGVAKTFTATISSSGVVTKGLTRTLNVAGTATATMFKGLSKTLNVTGTISASLSAAKAFLQDIDATVGITATIQSVQAKILSSGTTIGATIGKLSTLTRTLSATSTVTGSIAKGLSRTLEAATSITATIALGRQKVLDVATSITSTLNIANAKVLSIYTMITPTIEAARAKTMSATTTVTSTLNTANARVLSVVASITAKISAPFWRTKYPAHGDGDDYEVKYPHE